MGGDAMEFEGVSQKLTGPEHDKEQLSARQPPVWNPAASQNAIPGRIGKLLTRL
jgi:hypothetical protein